MGTIGELAKEMCACKTEEEATAFFDNHVENIRNAPDLHNGNPVTVAKANIGYIIGYYGPEERKRLHALFGVDHPIFGSKY